MIEIILYILEGKANANLRKEEGQAKDYLRNSKLRWKKANIAVTLKTKLNRKKSNRGCNDIIESRHNIFMDASAGNTG